MLDSFSQDAFLEGVLKFYVNHPIAADNVIQNIKNRTEKQGREHNTKDRKKIPEYEHQK